MSKVLTLASLASLLVLAPAGIAAAEERYTLEARSYFGGGPRLEAELVIEELSSGDLQVTVKDTDGSESHFVVPFASVPVLQRDPGNR